jgi:hypothetical protein
LKSLEFDLWKRKAEAIREGVREKIVPLPFPSFITTKWILVSTYNPFP